MRIRTSRWRFGVVEGHLNLDLARSAPPQRGGRRIAFPFGGSPPPARFFLKAIWGRALCFIDLGVLRLLGQSRERLRDVLGPLGVSWGGLGGVLGPLGGLLGPLGDLLGPLGGLLGASSEPFERRSISTPISGPIWSTPSHLQEVILGAKIDPRRH